MTADEIRKMKIEYDNPADATEAVFLREIAAQLAELNQRIVTLTSADGKLLDVRTHRTEL